MIGLTERKLHPKQRPNYYYLLDDPDGKRSHDNVAGAALSPLLYGSGA